MAQTLPTLDEVQKGIVDLYIAYFNRAPETKGLNDWTNYFYTQVAQGQDPDAVYLDMANQFFGLGFHFQALPPNLQTDNTALVKWAYQNVLGRDLDAEAAANTPPADPKFANAAEEAYQTWVPLLDNGMDKGSFFVTLIDVARNFENDPSWGWVYNYLEARNTLGLLFAKSKEGNITDPDQAITVGKQVLTGLTPDQVKANPNVDPQALAQQVFTQWEASQIGQTFTLTTGADNFVGTAGNDTVTATTATLTANDILVDTSSSDNDVIQMTATSKVTANGATILGFEKLDVTWDAFANAEIDAAGFKGVKEITASTSKLGNLGDLTVDNTGAATVTAGAGITRDLKVNGVTAATVNAGSAKTVTVSGSAAETDSVTVNAGGETTTIAVTGVETSNVVAGAKTNSITVTGVTTTIDASAAVKDAVITVAGTSGSTDAVTVKLGNDAAINVSGSNITGTEKLTLDVAAGKVVTVSGSVATVDVKGAGDVTLKVAATEASGDTVTKSNSGLLNVELTGNVSGATDVTKIAADSFKLTVASGGAVTAKSGQVFEVAAADASGSLALTASGSATTDTLTAKLTSAAYASVKGSGAETLVIEAAAAQASGAATAIDLTIATLGNSATSGGTATVVLKGSNDVKIGAVSGSKVLDASALNGTLNVGSGSGAVDLSINGAIGATTANFAAVGSGSTIAFVGQAGNDAITIASIASGSGSVAAGQATMLLGAGNDILTVSGSVSGVLSVQAGAGNDVVTLKGVSGGAQVVLEFGEGTDVLNLASGDYSVASSMILTGLETINLASGAAVTIGSAVVSGQTLNVTSESGSGTLTLKGSSGADTIDVSKFTVTDSITTGAKLVIDGDSGADTIILGSSKETVVLGAATADAKTINGFTAGVLGDVLDITVSDSTIKTLNASGSVVSGSTDAIIALTKDSKGATGSGSNLADTVFIFNGTVTDLATKIVTNSGDGALYLASGGKAVALIGNPADGAQTFSIYNITGTGSDGETITLVGTVGVNDGDALTLANFV